MSASSAKGYRLVPAEVPRRQRTTFYTDIIREFRKSHQESSLVEDTGKKSVTLVQGLRKALHAEGITDVAVLQRSGETFLVRRA
jgi:hypothetical protein